MPPRTPLPGAGDVIAGKYRLERLLKQGGMGSVWVATHLGLDERVAVKFMDPRRVSSAEARMRFTREAKAAAQIRSRNIVQILDHGVDNGVPYIAMELLAGEDLGARLRRAGRLSMVEASTLLEHIAHALDRAHAAGIVHRDLKPENIFLAKDGEHETPKVLDFGIALEVQSDASDDSAMTQEGVILGTPYFMSPEQVRGRTNIDRRSDLWSVGVIVFRAITGIRPFGRGAPADVIVQICSDPIPRASVVARDLPEEVDRFFEKALAREVGKRFSSAKEMAAAFSEIARISDAAEKTQQDMAPVHGDKPSSRERPSGRGRKGPPPLPKPYEVSKTIPSPGSEDEGADSAKTRQIGVVSERLAAMKDPPALGGLFAIDGGAGSGGERAGSGAQRSAEVSEPPVELTPEPIEEGEGTPVAAATTGTMPTRDMSASARPAEDAGARTVAATPVPAAISKPAETPQSGLGRTSESGRSLVSVSGPASARASKEPRSALWAALGLVLGMAIAGAAFREKLFGPPPGSKDPTSAATIVLTAGTVVLMSPGGVRAPAPTAEAAASAQPTGDAKNTTAAPSSAASAQPSGDAINANTAPSATASTSTSAPSANAIPTASVTASAPIGMGTVPTASPKATATATAKTGVSSGGKGDSTPPKKDDHDLGY